MRPPTAAARYVATIALLAPMACRVAPEGEGAGADPQAPAAASSAPEPVTPPSPPGSAEAVEPAAVAAPRAPTPCPKGMALVNDRFCIDRWEGVTLKPNGEQHSPYHAVGPREVAAASLPGVIPQAYISPEEADAACKRADKRLCTTKQWVDACMGTDKPTRSFPYGPTEIEAACNTQQRFHPTTLLHDGRRKEDAVSLNDPRINQIAATVAPTGAFERCVTPEGVNDMHGNLLEWTRSDRPLLMGGHYLDGKINGKGCTYVTDAHGPKYHDFTTGFRCCKKPDSDELASYLAEQKAGRIPPPPQFVQLPLSDDTRDPPGMRSFDNPMGHLPKPPPPPAYEPANAPCPVDMVHVHGLRCTAAIQQCLEWADDRGKAKRSCGEFSKPTECRGGRRGMSYCIDRHEFTPAGYRFPLVHVSWNEAQKLCHAMDKRLCHEAEWEFACEGPEALPYPYGFERDGARCNHDRDELFTNRGRLIDRRVAKDALPDCKSPFGVMNIVGNVDEWTTRASAPSPRRSILRGGWWLKGRNRCRASTDSHSEIYAGPQTGFRCCKAARGDR